jgi:hypothetical protein
MHFNNRPSCPMLRSGLCRVEVSPHKTRSQLGIWSTIVAARLQSAGAQVDSVSVSCGFGVMGDRDGRCYEEPRLPDLIPIEWLNTVCLDYDCDENMME